MSSYQGLDHYQLLNIRRNVTQEEIEVAYAKMALKHHPDIAGDSSKVQKKFAEINIAYSVLSKPHTRQDYDETLTTPERIQQEEVISYSAESTSTTTQVSDEPADSSSTSEAQVHEEEIVSKPQAKVVKPSSVMSRKKLALIKKQARHLLKDGDFWRASALMQKAAIAYPRDIDLRKLLAKAAAGRGRLREAVEELKKASEVEYFNPEIHCLMGNMYLRGNQIQQAKASFHNALSWQEDYSPALKGLQKIKDSAKKDLPWWKKILKRD